MELQQLKEVKRLKVGNRYWLDNNKDVSAKFVGKDTNGAYCFIDPEGNNPYLDRDSKFGKVIPFFSSKGFYKV